MEGADRMSGSLARPDFAAFYAVGLPRLTGFGTLITGGVAEAADLTQEALARALVQWRRVTDFGDPYRWTRRVLIHLMLSRRTGAAAAGKRILFTDGARQQLPPECTELLGILQDMPVRQRVVAALRYAEDLALEEITAAMSSTVAAVESDLSKVTTALGQAEQAPDADSEIRRLFHTARSAGELLCPRPNPVALDGRARSRRRRRALLPAVSVVAVTSAALGAWIVAGRPAVTYGSPVAKKLTYGSAQSRLILEPPDHGASASISLATARKVMDTTLVQPDRGPLQTLVLANVNFAGNGTFGSEDSSVSAPSGSELAWVGVYQDELSNYRVHCLWHQIGPGQSIPPLAGVYYQAVIVDARTGDAYLWQQDTSTVTEQICNQS